MRKESPKTFSEEEVVARLESELPQWRYQGGWIVREFKTSGWKSTLMVVNVIGHLAEAAWHHPDLAVTYARVKTKLITHSAKGVTEMDFALAKKSKRSSFGEQARNFRASWKERQRTPASNMCATTEPLRPHREALGRSSASGI